MTPGKKLKRMVMKLVLIAWNNVIISFEDKEKLL